MQTDHHRLQVTLRQTKDLTSDVRLFELVPDHPVPFELGSHIDIDLIVDGKPTRRSYSLIGESCGGDAWHVAVRRMGNGRGGSKAMWELSAGARLSVSAPISNFPLGYGASAYLLVAGGIGVTPIIGMAQRLKRLGAEFQMIYAGRNQPSMAFLDELRDSLGQALRIVTDAEGDSVDFTAEIAALPAGAEMYVCGPAGMLDAARACWSQSGRPVSSLRFETFGDSGRPVEPFTVRLKDHGGIEIPVSESQTLFEALTASGIETLSGCLRGECGICAVEVVETDAPLDHRDVFLSEQQKLDAKKICTCVSRAQGRVTIDTGYRP